jgi:hypothetical protein
MSSSRPPHHGLTDRSAEASFFLRETTRRIRRVHIEPHGEVFSTGSRPKSSRNPSSVLIFVATLSTKACV